MKSRSYSFCSAYDYTWNKKDANLAFYFTVLTSFPLVYICPSPHN